jgi:deazaflavin-dependent oxidoreductase (nitroreductase family)
MRYSESMPQTDYVKWVPKERNMTRIGKLHVRVYRSTFGLIGSRIDGLDIMLLTTIGKKSGEERVVPLPFFRDGKRYVLIASFGGNDKNPAWLSNLSANPDVRIQVGPRRMKARAQVAESTERERIWSEITRAYPRYLAYQGKTERKIPIVVLEPVKRRGLFW